MMSSPYQLIFHVVVLEILVTIVLFLFRASASSTRAGANLSLGTIGLFFSISLLMWFFVARTYYSSGIFVALLLVPFWIVALFFLIASVAGYLRGRIKASRATSNTQPSPTNEVITGVKGELLLVVFYFLYVAPLIAIFSELNALWIVMFEWVGPSVGTPIQLPLGLITSFLIAYALYVAYALWSRKPTAPAAAIWYLIFALGLGTASPFLWLFDSNAMGRTPVDTNHISISQILPYLSLVVFALNFVIGAILISYLKLSKRVHLIYGR